MVLTLMTLTLPPALAQKPLVVNGRTIPAVTLEVLLKKAKAQGMEDTPVLRKMIRENLIKQELLYQRAQSEGFTDRPELKSDAEEARRTVFIRAMVGEFLKGAIKDQDLRAEYEAHKAKLSGEKEYLARHILVDKEEEARALIARLKSGADFERLAKNSTDPGTRDNGGFLDWAPATNYPPEFAATLTKLPKGRLHDAPVKTQFGFHIIRLDDIRSAPIPSFEELRSKLLQQVQSRKFEELQTSLRNAATLSE